MSASANTFFDSVFVCMNGFPGIPECDVHAVSYAADGVEPFSNPFFSSSYDIGPKGECVSAVCASIRAWVGGATWGAVWLLGVHGAI